MRVLALILLLNLLLMDMSAQHFTAVAKHDQEGVHVKVYPSSLKAYEVYRKQGIDVSIGLTDGTEIIQKLSPAPEGQWKGNSSAEAGLHLLNEEVESGRAETFKGLIERDKQLRYSHGLYLMVTSMDEKASELSGMSWTIDTPPSELNFTIHSEAYTDLDTSITITAGQIARRTSSPTIETVGLQSAIEVVWDHGTYFREIIGYNIERRKGNGRWKQLNNSPIAYTNTTGEATIDGVMHMQYTDSTEADYISYDYRLIAIDFFGTRRLPSDISTNMSRDLTPPEIPLPLKVEFINDEALITWQQNAQNDIDKIVVIHSDDGPHSSYLVSHEGKLDAGLGAFSHAIANPETVRYYKLLMADTAGNVSISEPLFLDIPDIYPPVPPTGLKAFVDSLGQVNLMWHHSTSPDITGYKVFRSDHPDREFIQVSKGKITANLLIDQISLKKHNPEEYYFLRSVDDNYNNSIPSDTLVVMRPDSIAPSAPVLYLAEEKGSTIHVEWFPSSSLDVMHYIVLCEKDGGWEEVHRTGTESREADFKLNAEQAFKLTLIAEDKNGNRSERTRVLTLLSRDEEAPRLTAFEENGEVHISWTNNAGTTLLYKAVGEGGFRLIKAFDDEKPIYQDREIQKGQVYRYAIAIQHENGLKGALGEEQVVEVK